MEEITNLIGVTNDLFPSQEDWTVICGPFIKLLCLFETRTEPLIDVV